MNDRNLFHAATAEDILVEEDEERINRTEHELWCALDDAIEVLGLEWTTDLFEKVTKRRVKR